MLFSSRPLNVLTDLIRPRGIEINYTFGHSGRAVFVLDATTYATRLFPQMMELVSNSGEQQVGFKITPLSAQGKPFTTGNDTLDRLASNALLLLEGSCKFPSTKVEVETRRREHLLIFPQVYLHLRAVHRSQAQGEFALATNLAISTKGYITLESAVAS